MRKFLRGKTSAQPEHSMPHKKPNSERPKVFQAQKPILHRRSVLRSRGYCKSVRGKWHRAYQVMEGRNHNCYIHERKVTPKFKPLAYTPTQILTGILRNVQSGKQITIALQEIILQNHRKEEMKKQENAKSHPKHEHHERPKQEMKVDVHRNDTSMPHDGPMQHDVQMQDVPVQHAPANNEIWVHEQTDHALQSIQQTDHHAEPIALQETRHEEIPVQRISIHYNHERIERSEQPQMEGSEQPVHVLHATTKHAIATETAQHHSSHPHHEAAPQRTEHAEIIHAPQIIHNAEHRHHEHKPAQHRTHKHHAEHSIHHHVFTSHHSHHKDAKPNDERMIQAYERLLYVGAPLQSDPSVQSQKARKRLEVFKTDSEKAGIEYNPNRKKNIILKITAADADPLQ